MFLLYINDFENASSFKLTQFADDTLLYLSSKNLTSLEYEINQSLIEVEKWINCNKLTINLSKSKFMLIAPKSVGNIHIQNFDSKIYDQKLERVREYKYFGVIFDEKLSWKAHISYLLKKLSKTAGIYYKLKTLVNKKKIYPSALCISAFKANV